MVIRRTALIAGLATLVMAGDASASCGGPVTAHAQGKAGAGQRRAWLIGDSTSIFAVPRLARRRISANARGCRQISEGVDLIRRRRHVPHLVVLALGSNGPVTRADIGAALRAVGDGHVVGLATPRNHAETAAVMRAAARARPDRLLLIDWRAHSAGHGSWFSGDGLHLSYDGATAFARLVRRRAAGLFAPPVRALGRLRGAEPRATCGTVGRGSLRVVVLRGPRDCGAARAVARRPPLSIGLRSRWSWFDWRPVRSGWRDVYTRAHRRWVVATAR